MTRKQDRKWIDHIHDSIQVDDTLEYNDSYTDSAQHIVHFVKTDYIPFINWHIRCYFYFAFVIQVNLTIRIYTLQN